MVMCREEFYQNNSKCMPICLCMPLHIPNITLTFFLSFLLLFNKLAIKLGFVEFLINVEVDTDVNLPKENLGYLQSSTEEDNCDISSSGEDSSFG